MNFLFSLWHFLVHNSYVYARERGRSCELGFIIFSSLVDRRIIDHYLSIMIDFHN